MPENAANTAVNLRRFTLGSLSFCQTPLAAYRGLQFVDAVNQWYLPAIRGGSAPPLGFLLDVGNLLLRPSLGFEHRAQDRKSEVRELLHKYLQMLVRLREQPIFCEVVSLIEQLRETEAQFRAAGQFLKFLLIEFHRFGEAFYFKARNEFRLESARVTRQGLVSVQGSYGDEALVKEFTFDQLAQTKKNEYATLITLYRRIADFYSTEPLEKFISAEERLVVELAARHPTGVEAADYCLMKRLLELGDIPAPDALEPAPKFVELTVPTESMQVDGPTSGYVDLQTRTFSGNIGDILPVELATASPGLSAHRAARYQFYDRLANGGVAHYVRETIVCVEREFRLLVTFVVDAQERMRSLKGAREEFSQAGISPYVRGRGLLAAMLRDLALFFPREDVALEVALCLWNGETQTGYRQHFNLFEKISLEDAGDPLCFARRLVQLAPYFCEHRLSLLATRSHRDGQDVNPFRFAQDRHRLKHFHGRHLVLFSQQRALESMLRSLGDPGMTSGSGSPNYNLAVSCDVDYHTMKVEMPDNFADLGRRNREQGRLSESDLRTRLLDELLSRATGRPANSSALRLEGSAL